MPRNGYFGDREVDSSILSGRVSLLSLFRLPTIFSPLSACLISSVAAPHQRKARVGSRELCIVVRLAGTVVGLAGHRSQVHDYVVSDAQTAYFARWFLRYPFAPHTKPTTTHQSKGHTEQRRRRSEDEVRFRQVSVITTITPPPTPPLTPRIDPAK
jgi:hypothetical protein